MKDVRQYYGPCYSVAAIDEGEAVPVGGKNFMSVDTDLAVKADFATFQPLFDRARQLQAGYKPEKTDASLQANGITAITAQDFLPLHAFQNALNEQFPARSANTGQRGDLYHGDSAPSLSQVFANGSAMCAEIALVAHKFAGDAGLKARAVHGSAIWSREDEFPEAHSFLAIERERDVLLYDPANPSGGYPSLYPVSRETFASMESSKAPCFLIVKNALTGVEAGFGVSSGVNVVPERQFIEQPTVIQSPKQMHSVPLPANKLN